MTIDITGLGRDRALAARIERLVADALGALGTRPLRAHIAFLDENGPKGGRALRCAVTVTLPYRPVVRVEHVGETPRLAFDAAFAGLERRLASYREIRRESRRRPKKYFAAKRLLASGGATEAGRRTEA